MKNIYLPILATFLLSLNSFAQVTTTGNVGVGTITPSIDAILDIAATDRGLLIPRLNTVQMNSIFTTWNQCQPGLLIFNIDDKQFYYNASSSFLSPPEWTAYPISKCPTNFVAVGNEFCIQANTQTSSTWETAAIACQNVQGNSHLCSWAEWFAACQANSPSIFNMTTGTGEWVNDALSDTEALVLGNGSCSSRNAVQTNLQRNFRCCFKR